MPYSGVNRVGRIVSAVTSIKNQATALLGLSGTVQFDTLLSYINQMHNAYLNDVVPALSLGESTLNTIAGAAGYGGMPANTYTSLIALQTALNSFFTAYATLYAGAGNVMSYNAATGHAFISVQVSALSSLVTPLNNIVTASTPLVLVP